MFFYLTTLLLGDTDSPAATTRRLGVLAADTQAPVVSETAVGADLLQALQVVTQLRVDAVRQDLRVLAIGDIALSVEEPCIDLLEKHTSPFFFSFPLLSSPLLVRKEMRCSRTGRDLVLSGVLDDGDNSLELFRSELTGTMEGCILVSITLHVYVHRYSSR